MTNREIAQLHCQWWQRTNEEPVVGVFAPITVPYGGLDLHVAPADMVERKRVIAQALAEIPNDKLRVARVDFSTAFVPALAGAGFESDQYTSWSHPIADTVVGLKIPEFDPTHPLFVHYLDRLRPLLDTWSWDTYLPSLADYLGPLDVIAALVGPEALALEMYENPDDVCRVAMDAAAFHRQMLAFELKLHHDAGMTEGVTDVFSTWLPGRGVRFSEDVTALMGERHYRDFFLAADAAWLNGLDSTFMHTHSVASACLPGILDLPNLGAVEISNDPNGPDLDHIIAAGRLVQKAGKPLQISNWEHPLTEDEIKRLVTELDTKGLCITLQAESISHAQHLYNLAKNS